MQFSLYSPDVSPSNNQFFINMCTFLFNTGKINQTINKIQLMAIHNNFQKKNRFGTVNEDPISY